MNRRQQFEADLEVAKGELARAASELAAATAMFDNPHTGVRGAGSNLRHTVTALAKAQADHAVAKAQTDLEKARANCRRATAALAEFDRDEAVRQAARSGEQAARAAEKSKQADKFTGSLAAARQAHLLVPREERDRAMLVKHTVMLLAVVFAYLQYYFVDAQLQIARLPAATIYLLG
jgi:hypothetical protein